jgi:hypothetical protein
MRRALTQSWHVWSRVTFYVSSRHICNSGGRVTRLSLVYENTSATSSYQGSKATCVEADYPTYASLTINGVMKMEVSLL